MNLRERKTIQLRSALLCYAIATPAPRKLADVLDPGQRDDFAALAPPWRRVAGHNYRSHAISPSRMAINVVTISSVLRLNRHSLRRITSATKKTPPISVPTR
jgi:hypothetical protein